MTIPIHPAALVFPEMPSSDFAHLKSDIKKHGLLTPIELHDGKIIDGRHRYRACQELGIDIPQEMIVEVDFKGMAPGEYVWSLNGARRHLSESQRAAVFQQLIGKVIEQEAKKRQKESGGDRKSDVAILPPPIEKAKSRDEIARKAGVSPRTVQDAATVAKKDPELFERVKKGEVSASKAAKEVRERRSSTGSARRVHRGEDKGVKKAVAYSIKTDKMQVLRALIAKHMNAEQLRYIINWASEQIVADAFKRAGSSGRSSCQARSTKPKHNPALPWFKEPTTTFQEFVARVSNLGRCQREQMEELVGGVTNWRWFEMTVAELHYMKIVSDPDGTVELVIDEDAKTLAVAVKKHLDVMEEYCLKHNAFKADYSTYRKTVHDLHDLVKKVLLAAK